MNIVDPLEVKEKAEKFFQIKLSNTVSVFPLNSERLQIYSSFLIKSNAPVMALVIREECKEIIYQITADKEIHFPVVSCQITYEDVPLADCPEYCFTDDPVWRLAQVSDEALDHFRQKKFKLWENQIKEPECEAAFRRLLQQGPIRNVYDKFIFPSRPEVADSYKVKDEHSGKLVDIPHQVDRMRKWDPASQKYVLIDCSLVGAPLSDSHAMQYWKGLLEELRELRGKDYIDNLLGLDRI